MEYNEHIGMTIEECISKYKKLINDVARKNFFRVRATGTFSLEDLKQIAIEGFIKAYNNYDSSKKVKVSSYLYRMMTFEILEVLKKHRTVVSFPQSFSVVWGIAAKRGVTSMKQIGVIMKNKPDKISEAQVKRAMEWYGSDTCMSLDKPVDNHKKENSNHSYYDILASDGNDTTVVIVNDFLETLTEKQRQVAILLMEEKTQKEIANIMGISQQQVSRIANSLKEAYIKYAGADGE